VAMRKTQNFLFISFLFLNPGFHIIELKNFPRTLSISIWNFDLMMLSENQLGVTCCFIAYRFLVSAYSDSRILLNLEDIFLSDSPHNTQTSLFAFTDERILLWIAGVIMWNLRWLLYAILTQHISKSVQKFVTCKFATGFWGISSITYKR